MNNILLIARNALQRSRIFILMSLLAGVMLCVVYVSGRNVGMDYAGSGAIDIGVVDMDNSDLSEHFRTYLSETLGMNIVDETSYDELTKALIDTDLSVIIEVPEGFAQSAVNGEFQKLTLTTTNDYENTAFIQAYIDTYMQGVSAAAQSADGDAALFASILEAAAAESEPLCTESAVVTSREDELNASAFRLTMGFYLMLVMGVAICVTFLVVTDKKQNTLNRMRISSVSAMEYVMGTVLSSILICGLTAVIPLVFILVRGDHIGISFGLAVLYFVLFLLFAVGFALVSSLAFNSMEAILPVMIGFASVGCILGGAWFPIDKSIGFLHMISYFMPQYWIMDYLDAALGSGDILENAGTSASALTSIGILVLFTMLMYLIAVVLFSRKRAK